MLTFFQLQVKHEGNNVVRARGNHLICQINNVDTTLRKAQIVAIVLTGNSLLCGPENNNNKTLIVIVLVWATIHGNDMSMVNKL